MAKVIKSALIAAAAVFVTIAIVASGGTLAPLFTSGALAFGGSTAAFAIAAQYAIVTLVGSIVAGGIGMLTSRGISASRQNFGTKIAGRGAQVPRQIVYGECRVGGTIVKMHTSGTKNNKLHLAIVLAGHEIESLQGVYFNDTLLTTTSSTTNGETVYRVSNAKFKNSENENAITSGGVLVQYTFHDGSQTTVDGLASANASSRYPSTAKFQGMAYVYMEVVYDPEKIPGLPPLHFRVRGKKVYDPRTSTTAFSSNPALIIRDFLTDTTYGLRALSSEINDTTSGGGFAAAANACDADVTLADNSSTEDRFTLNGFVNASSAGDAILEGFLSSCAGKITHTNGKFNLFVGTAQTATLTIGDDDVLDTQQLSTKSGNGDLFNGIKALYVDKEQNYQGAETPILVDSTYLSEDTPSGEQSANYKKILETQLPFTVTHTMAQRLQKIQLKRHRESATLSLLTTLEFMKLQPGDWVNVTNDRLSYSAKSFEVLSTQMEFAENEGVVYAATRLTLQEVSAGIYGYVFSEYSTPQTTGSTPPGGDLSVGSPTAGTLSQRTRPEGPTAKIDIIASWTNALEAHIQGTEIQYREDGETAYDVATLAGRGATTAVISNVQVGKTYDVRVRHFSWDNVYGAFVDYDQVTIAEPDTLSAPGNPAATTDKPFFIELTWTNPSNANFRAVEVHYSTSSGFTPDSNTLLNTYYGEPAKQKKVILGVSAGLAYDTNYFFKLRSVNVYGTTSGYTNQATGQFKKAQDADVENLNANSITAGTIDASTITVENIDAGEISTGTLSSDRVNTGQIVVGGLESGVTITQGSLTMNAGGHLKGGQTEYNDTDASGFFLGYDTDAYKFSIGNSDNSKAITFDGSELTVKGAITATSLTLNADAKADLLADLELTEEFYALNTINYGPLANITFTPNFINANANIGEVTVSAGVIKAGSTSRTTSQQVLVTPFEGATKPPYTGNHFYVISGASQAWASDTSARFQTSDTTTTSYGGTSGMFIAIYDEENDQWKAVDNVNAKTDFTPLDTDYVIAVGTKTSSTGGIDSLKSLVVYADDPEADQTVNALETGTTITSGGITLSSGGSIKGGQTEYNDADASGFFLGYDSNAYKLSIGNADNSQRLTFDGSNLGVKGTITVGSTDLTETNTLNANTTPSDVGLNVDYALEGINYNALSNITFLANSSQSSGGANDGETYITAGTLKAGSTTRTIAAGVMHSPYEGATKPPYSGNHFFIISGASDAWASDSSARFQTSNNETLSDNATNNHLFIAIYDDVNDQWKAVDNSGGTTNFTPLTTDYVIAVGTKTSSSGGYDSLVPLTVYADDPEADQTVNALEATTTITGGGITMSSGGAIKGGQTGFDSGTGFFLGYDTDAYKFSIGNAGNNSLTFNGSTLAVSGNITANSLSLASSVAIDGDNLPIDIYAGVDSTTINKDPYFAKRDGAYWRTNSTQNTSIDNDSEFTFKTDGTGLPTNRSTYLQGVSSDDANDQFFSEDFTLESNKAYRITVWVRQPSGAKKNYLLVNFKDSSGVTINNSSSPVSDATGFSGGIGTYHYWGLANQAFPTSFTKYEVVIGGNSSVQPPSNAATFSVGALTLRSEAGSTTTVDWAQYHVEEIDTAATNASVTSIGGVTITSSSLYQGTGTFNNANTGFYLDNTGQFSLKDKLSFDGTDLTVSGAVTAASFTLSSGATLSDADDQIQNTNNNAFFRYETTAANDAVVAPTDTQFNTAFGRDPRTRDVVIVVNTASDPDVSAAYIYNGSSWDAKNDFLTGDLIVDGTIKASNIDVTDLITSGSLLTDSATISNNIRIGSGDSVFSADGDGIYLGNETFGSAEFRVTPAGVMTASGATITGGSVSNTTTVGGTAASTVASGAAAGATASQVNKGLALLINQQSNGSSNTGECGLVGVDKDGSPELNTNGFIIYNGTKYTVDRHQYASHHTILTNLANKKGFICIDVNNTKPFDTTGYGNLDIAFVYKVGDQWYYDENSTNEIQFTPSSITGNQTGTDNTTTPILLAIGYLETGSADNIAAGGLFEPVELESAPFYGDTYNSGTVGGISIDGSKLYSGTGTWNNANTGFYLDDSGKFSLKDKLFFNPTNNLLTVDGNITADVITAKQNLIVLGDLEASSVAAGSITRAMFSQDALDEIFGSLATAVGGSNGDYKSGSGSFTTSGGSVELGTSSDKFDHGTSSVEVEFNINTYFYSTTNYTQAQAQATLTFEATADGTYNDLNAADKTHTLQFSEYDLSSYYGYTYLVYHINTAIVKTFTSGSGNDLADNVDVQFRVAVSGVGSAFTGQTIPFDLEANEGVTGVTSTGGNADTLDNLDSTAFLRSNENDTFDGDLTITGDLVVQGTQTSLEVATLQVEDKNIVLNYGTGNTSGSADGAGITIQDAVDGSTDATILWDATNDKFDFSHSVNATGAGTFSGSLDGSNLKIGGTATIDSSRRLLATGAADLLDGTTPAVSGSIAYFPTKMVSPKFVFLNDAGGDDNYIVSNDNNNTHFVNGNQSGVWVEFYGDKTLSHAGLVYDWWKGKGAELKQFTNTTGTAGTTFLTIHNAVGSNDTNGDISQQQTFIDFVFTDSNANEYPQVRIGAQVGPDADANSTTLEGQGAFVVYTNNAQGANANDPTPTGLNESFRVSYDGDATIAGSLGVAGITSTGAITLDSAGHGYLIIDNGGSYESGIIWRRNGASEWETYISSSNEDFRFYSYGATATQLTIRDGVNGNGGTLLSGLKVTDGSAYYGSYGNLVFNSNQNYTSTSRGWMITNGYKANQFAILYSNSATTLPSIDTTGGNEATGTSVALKIDNAGAVTIPSLSTDSFSVTGGSFTISSTGSATLTIAADTDNATSEDENPTLVMTQDGGLFYSHVGVNGSVNNKFTGATANTSYIYSALGFQIATDATNTAKLSLTIEPNGTTTLHNGTLKLVETASIASQITFVDSDTAENFAIKLNGESLDFLEPEDTNKLHMRIVDDGGVNAPLGFNTGANNGIQRISADGDLVNIGYLEATDYLQLGLGTTSRQSTDYLYVGGNSLDGADAAIYLGNHGGGSGYGWRLYYHGTGSANTNDLSIQSENLGSPVNVLRFNQDGVATFANYINAEQITFDSTSGSGTGGGRIWDVKYVGDDHLAIASIDKSSGSLILGYGAEGGTSGGNSFTSTFDNFSGKRSAVQFRSDSVCFWGTNAGVQTAVGDALTTMTKRITLHTDNGDADFDGTVDVGAFTTTGSVLIGTDSGDAFNGNSRLRLQQNGNTYIQIKTETTQSAGLLLGDTSDDFAGGLIYDNNTDVLSVYSGNSTALTLDASRNGRFYQDLTVAGDLDVESGRIDLDAHSFVLQKTYSGTSIFSQSGDWYTLCSISESNTPAYFSLKFSAHSTMTFLVTTGYNGSNVATINVLGTSWTQNGGYPAASALRVVKQTSNAVYYVQMKLTYSSASVSGFALYARTWGASEASGVPTLVSSLSAYTEAHSVIVEAETNFSLGTYNAANAYFGRGVYATEYIYHKDDTDTYLRFQDNRVGLFSGGGAIVDAHSNGNLYLTGTTVAVYGNMDIGGTTLEVGDGGTNGVIDVKATANAYFKVNGTTEMTLTPSKALFENDIEADGLIKTNSSTSNGLIINNATGTGAGIRFSDQTTDGSAQQGYFKFFHVNGSSYGKGAAFVASSTEDLAFVVDGQLQFSTLAIKASSGTGAGTQIIDSSGNAILGNGGDIAMDASGNGQLEVLGNGYRGAIALNTSAMHIYHNSSSRSLILGTDETARITIGGAGGINFNSNDLTGIVDMDVSGDIVMSGSNNFLVIENSTENDAGIVFNDLQAGAWPNASSQRFMMQFNSGGESGLGSMIMGHDDDSYIGFYFKKGGELECKGNVTAFGTTSDIRLKDNVKVIPNALEKVMALRGVTFTYKKDGLRSTGLIAQELKEVLPEVVYETNDVDDGEEYYAVRYGNTAGLLVEAVKELKRENDELREMVKTLMEKINDNH